MFVIFMNTIKAVNIQSLPVNYNKYNTSNFYNAFSWSVDEARQTSPTRIEPLARSELACLVGSSLA